MHFHHSAARIVVVLPDIEVRQGVRVVAYVVSDDPGHS
jgi:hypothetical protein